MVLSTKKRPKKKGFVFIGGLSKKTGKPSGIFIKETSKFGKIIIKERKMEKKRKR